MKNITPLKAIRRKCLKCCAGSIKEVKCCHLENCPLWDYRFGKRPKSSNNGKKILSVMKAIRTRCLDCSSYEKAEIKNCDIPGCFLYPFRLGKNVNRVGNAEALKKHRFYQKAR